MVRGDPPRAAAFLDEHQEQGRVQRAIGPRLAPWRLRLGAEHAAVEVYYGDIGADGESSLVVSVIVLPFTAPRKISSCRRSNSSRLT